VRGVGSAVRGSGQWVEVDPTAAPDASEIERLRLAAEQVRVLTACGPLG
jgi:hypothetical protein